MFFFPVFFFVDEGKIGLLIVGMIIECRLNLIAWKATWAHRSGENEKENHKKCRSKRQVPVDKSTSIGGNLRTGTKSLRNRLLNCKLYQVGLSQN